jgi:hypothetical protein
VTTINSPALSVCYCAFSLSSFRRCEQLIASCSPSRITMQMRQRSMCGEVIARRCAPPGLKKSQILCSQTVVSRVERSKLVHIENLENRIIPPASVSAASQSRRERSSFRKPWISDSSTNDKTIINICKQNSRSPREISLS